MRPALIVRVSDSKSATGVREVEGRLVVEGLAITPSVSPAIPGDDAPRFVLTHISSGKCVPGLRCAKHIEEAAVFVVGAGVDWTVDLQALVDNPKVREVAQELQIRFGYCSRHCDRPDAASDDGSLSSRAGGAA